VSFLVAAGVDKTACWIMLILGALSMVAIGVWRAYAGGMTKVHAVDLETLAEWKGDVEGGDGSESGPTGAIPPESGELEVRDLER